MRTCLFLVVIMVIVALSGCSKDDASAEEVIPALSCEGKNVFGCRVDDEVWLPRRYTYSIMSPKIFEGFYHKDFGALTLLARREYTTNLKREIIRLQLDSIYSEGIYFFDFVDSSMVSSQTYFSKVFEDRTEDYTFPKSQVSRLEVVCLDTNERIVSGTFELILTNQKWGGVRITDGIFDISY